MRNGTPGTIPILGGGRSYFMLLILLAWQILRFNEAVQKQRVKAALRAFTGEEEQKASNRRAHEHNQSFAAASQAQRSRCAARQAYQAWMHTSYDVEMRQLMGFLEAKPRVEATCGLTRKWMPCCNAWQNLPRVTRPFTPGIPFSTSPTTPCGGRRATTRLRSC